MYQHILVRQNMKPIPDTIKIVQDYGLETIIPEGSDLTHRIVGRNLLLEGSPEAFVDWLKPFDGVWVCSSPMVGDWKVVHIKRELANEEVAPPQT